MRILVVDDEATVREAVSGALTRAGYSVITAAEPRTVLDEFDAGQYDVLIMDAMLGRIGGVQFAAQLQQFDPQLRVTILSDEPEDEARAKKEGFTFCLKPLRPEAMGGLLKMFREV
ncbi:MAG: response regulator [Elusimicrobia bacterium]|nr:response regulator [Elusimicrobiota bacterium]